MSVEIIRVEEPENISWPQQILDGAKRQAKERPHLAIPILTVGGVVAAPMIATTVGSVALAAAGGLIATSAVELFLGPETPPPVTYLPADLASHTQDIHGQPLRRGITYMRHPRPSEMSRIIKSTDFHSYIMSQQVSEIIHYLRAETHLKSLSILIRSADRTHVVVGGKLEKFPVNIKADARNANERRMTLTCDDENRIEHLLSYVWLNDFPEVVAATRYARRGKMQFSQSTDMSFGMTGNFAKYAKFSAGWLSTFVIEVEASFS